MTNLTDNTNPARKPEKSKSKAEADAAAIKANNEIRTLNGTFGADLPQGTSSSGHYEAAEGDRFAGDTFTAPDGLYRVEGSNWLFKIEAGKLVEANRATPPNFGGESVVSIPDRG